MTIGVRLPDDPHGNNIMLYRVQATRDAIGIFDLVYRTNGEFIHVDWLHNMGKVYPSGSSFWTEKGFNRYVSSGLFVEHVKIVIETIEIIKINNLTDIQYEDEYQIIGIP